MTTINIHGCVDEAIKRQLNRIEAKLDAQLRNEETMKADLTDVLAAVEEQKTVDESIEKLVDGLAAKLDEMATATTVDPADLAALATSVRDNNAGIRAKVVANTPAAPPPA